MHIFIVFFSVLCISLATGKAWAVENGFCQGIQLEEIPVGNFHHPLAMPMDPMRVTQHYNTSLEEGYCQAPGQPSGDSPLCQGYQIYYGHDGLDLHPLGAPAGEEDIYSVQAGLVVASHPSGSFSGWGESLIIATRANPYSEGILTFHYHHLYKDGGQTSRLVGRFEEVWSGQVIAKEGGTPNWPTHLHLSIKYWANLSELTKKITNSPTAFYGPGYTFGDDGKIANYLDPEGLLYDYFTEFNQLQADYPTWQWSDQYARGMRSAGWFFGNFDGSFGVDLEVKRREGARWIKQALRLNSPSVANQHFDDLPPGDSDAIYVQALLEQPLAVKVINPDRSCTILGQNFCPDQSLTRAEALKMIVTGFYQDQFLEIYNNWVWQAAAPLANSLLSHFTDVNPWEWYAPYIYFAWQKGLTGGGAIFNPNLPIRRAELAKWLVLAAEDKFGGGMDFCQGLNCPYGDYCDQNFQTCLPIPECVPEEEQTCELGGGYDLQNDPGGPGSSDECVQGQEELKLCPDNQTATYHVCLVDGQWSAWNPPCPDNPGDGGTGGASGSGGSGTGGDGGTGGSSGSGGSGTGGDGGTGGSSGSGDPEPPCQVNYYLSPSGASCYSNPSASGSPTLCLETFLGSGAQASWRLCKQGSTFQNSFTYELLDQNNLSQNLGGQLSGSAGAACTPWKAQDFSYVDQDGPANGAGLIVEVHSPSGCSLPSCTYYTGITTLYRQCQ